MYHVFSTLTADNVYCRWIDGGDGPHIAGQSVLIKGGSNVANKHVTTVKGVMTTVSDEEYEILKNDHHFKEHEKNGFISVQKSKKNPEEVAKKELQAKDRSAPKTPEDFNDGGAPLEVKVKE